MAIPTEGWMLGEQSKVDAKPMPFNLAPYLTEPERWRNYTNDELYELECLLREFMASQPRSWERNVFDRRYTFGMVFHILIGHAYVPKNDAWASRPLSRLLRHYSSRIQKEGMIRGKKTTKKIYTLSPKRLEKPPYSLRLRIEWMNERGLVPGYQNLRVEPDDLKAGMARNKLSNDRMQERSRKGREKYERWKREQNESGARSQGEEESGMGGAEA